MNGLRHEKWPFSRVQNTDKMYVHGSIQHQERRHRFQNPSIYSSFGCRAARRLGLVVLLSCVSRDVYNRISCQNSCSLYQSTTSHLRVLLFFFLFFFGYHCLLAPSIDFAVWIKGIRDIIETPSARNVWRLIRVIEIKWDENECLSWGWKNISDITESQIWGDKNKSCKKRLICWSLTNNQPRSRPTTLGENLIIIIWPTGVTF